MQNPERRDMGTIRSNKKRVEEKKQYELRRKDCEYHSEGFRARQVDKRQKENMTCENDIVIFSVTIQNEDIH